MAGAGLAVLTSISTTGSKIFPLVKKCEKEPDSRKSVIEVMSMVEDVRLNMGKAWKETGILGLQKLKYL